MFEQILAKSAELKAQMDILRKEAAAMVKPLLSEFIKSNPQVTSVKWTQYTPYFNDGESCVFRVGEPEFYFDGMDTDDEGHSSWSLGNDQYGPTAEQASPATRKACKGLADALAKIEDALEELFGDHVQVIVTADGVEVDEYDHD